MQVRFIGHFNFVFTLEVDIQQHFLSTVGGNVRRRQEVITCHVMASGRQITRYYVLVKILFSGAALGFHILFLGHKQLSRTWIAIAAGVHDDKHLFSIHHLVLATFAVGKRTSRAGGVFTGKNISISSDNCESMM